jgi:hypothetical protein
MESSCREDNPSEGRNALLRERERKKAKREQRRSGVRRGAE